MNESGQTPGPSLPFQKVGKAWPETDVQGQTPETMWTSEADNSLSGQPLQKDPSMVSTLSVSSICPPLEERMFSQETTCDGMSIASSSGQYAEAGQTLLFLDWDDTLFPTTALFETWGLRRDAEIDTELPEELAGQLQDWRTALVDFLTEASTVSERCIILTNSKRPWVHNCIRRFAPAIKILESCGKLVIGQSQLSVVYALEVATSKRRYSRDGVRAVMSQMKLEEELSEYLMKSKQIAMRQEAKDFYSKYPGQTWKNLISIGDMSYEHVALQEMTFRRVGAPREQLRSKAITVPTSPSLGQISARLHCSKHLLRPCVYFDGDFSINLEGAPEPLQVLGEGLEMPQIASLTPLCFAWGQGSPPSGAELTAALTDLSRLCADESHKGSP